MEKPKPLDSAQGYAYMPALEVLHGHDVFILQISPHTAGSGSPHESRKLCSSASSKVVVWQLQTTAFAEVVPDQPDAVELSWS